jgi:hypothetical protein
MKEPFKKRADRLLQRAGRTFRGIRLRCTNCGEEAFAATPQLAETFGWSKVKQVKGASYHGICVECRGPSPGMKGSEP